MGSWTPWGVKLTYTCKEMRNAIADEKGVEEQKALNDPRKAEYLVDVDLDAPMHTDDIGPSLATPEAPPSKAPETAATSTAPLVTVP